MSRPYLPPAWSADNAKVDLCFFLEVLKDGAIVDKVELNEEMSSSGNGASGMIGNKRSYFKAGRQEDAVDVVLQHASISRVHAILQYRDDGALMLLDQGTQGTQVNKKACEQGAYQRLYVGDVIVFGASTRKYIVGGPEAHKLPEYDSENLQKYRQRLQDRAAAKAEEKEKDKEGRKGGDSEYASWGQEEDDANQDHTADEDRARAMESQAEQSVAPFTGREEDLAHHPKDQKLWDKLETTKRKVSNLAEESKKIMNKKAGGSLSEGQEATLSRNEERVSQLEEDVLKLLHDIHAKTAVRAGVVLAAKKGASRSREREEEDDMLDETVQNAGSGSSTNWRMKKRRTGEGV